MEITREEIARLASILFSCDITEQMVAVSPIFKRGEGRFYKAYIVNNIYTPIIETEEVNSYKRAIEILYKKVQLKLNKGET